MKHLCRWSGLRALRNCLNRWTSLTVALLFAAACSSPAAAPSGAGEDVGIDIVIPQFDIHQDSGGKDAHADSLSDAVLPSDAVKADLGGMETAIDDGDGFSEGDLANEVDASDAGSDTSSGCDFPANPATGEPGSTCKTADDCDSGFCVDGPNGKMCTSSCISCCPGGFECAKMPGNDAAFACLPKQLALCQPCTTDAQCGAADAGSLCISYGDGGSFCGAACVDASDCPTGYACQVADGQLGVASQCVLTAGECNCTKWGALVGASTNCQSSNSFGTCAGVRKCAIDGLPACSAPVPATETCNGVDDNCDGKTDPANSVGCVTYFLDNDGDGFGGGAGSCLCANPGDGYTTIGGDCDDKSAAIHPGAKEICDGLDNDCNGITDDGFPDSNGDGFADCVDPDIDGDGWLNAQDCAPTNPAIHPGATEICDGLDNDCNGITDDPGAVGCTLWYQDNDGDGAGAGVGECLCGVTGTYTASVGGDCNDSNAGIHPGATEICNNFDDNCNGLTDEGCDDDLDLWCDATMTVVGTPSVCPSGKQDCDDTNPAIHPGQKEICGNGIDDNCDGLTDSGTDLANCTVYYVDNDGDGYGDVSLSQCLCSPTPLYATTVGGDCDDTDPSVHPKATEVCNGKDDDCDGTTDVNATDCKDFFNDADGDGYGVSSDEKCLCAATGTYTATVGGDCNDAASAIHPGAAETCNGIDDDCDGVTDPPNTADCSPYFKDADGDGYGNFLGGSKCLCAAIPGYVSQGGDCDDANAAVHPNAPEICNGIDDNCDGLTDPINTTGCTNYHLDGDGDTYGQSFAKCMCAPSGLYTSLNGDDCDDTNSAVHPGATEICDGIDNNCNGLTDEGVQITYYTDADGDGYGTGTGNLQCAPTSAFSATLNGDCDDTNPNVHPLAPEICNGIDDNCNGLTDEGASPTTYYQDSDGDGYGNPAVSKTSCGAVAGYVTSSTDCNDANATMFPGNPEVCDGKDNDCNGLTDDGLPTGTWYPDADKDGYGAIAGPSVSGCQPTGYVADHSDCDDTKPGVHPGATETCNSIDDNCNGQTDEGLSCQTCTATVVDAINKSSDATTNSHTQQWYFDMKGEFTATSGTQYQYYRWGLSDACGYLSSTNDQLSVPFTVPASASFLAIDVAFDNTYDTGVPDTQLYMTLTFDGVTKQVGPFSSLHGTGWITVTWPVSAAQLGQAKTILATVQSAQSNIPCTGGIAIDNVRTIAGCSDLSAFCAPAVGGLQGSQAWYKDVDGDGYGDPATVITTCATPAGYVTLSGDCSDGNASIHPGAAEICDGLDNDCDGVTDDLSGAVLNAMEKSSDYVSMSTNWWYGPAVKTQGTGSFWAGNNSACGYPKLNDTVTFKATVPTGATGVAIDVFFDNRLSFNPDVADTSAKLSVTFNGKTQNVGPFATIQNPKWRTLTFPVDATMYGTSYTFSATVTTATKNTVATCVTGASGGFALDNVRSTATCAGAAPACTTGVTASSWYKDADGDGYGDANSAVSACIEPTGYIATGGDCDDTNAAVNPGVAKDTCATVGVDDNCDGVTDGVNSTSCSNFYTDADGDGYGATSATATCACSAPAGMAGNKTDCNDANAAVHPGATEICNGIDDNCDGVTDPQNTSGCLAYYVDADADGYGATGNSQCWCAAHLTYVTLVGGDCNDANANINPGELEVCNGVDDNCNGLTDEGLPTGTWYKDADGDGHGNPDIAQAVSGCDYPGYVAFSAADDCNDSDATIYPGAPEICDAKDNNCNGQTDEGLPTGTWYRDADGDGYGNMALPITNSCELPGYVTSSSDCNDANANIHPGATEVCYDGIDNNCDGQTDENCTACTPTLVQGFNASSSNVKVGGSGSQWFMGTDFTPSEGSACAIFGGKQGYLNSTASDVVTVTFTVPANSPYLTIDYIFDNLASAGVADTTLQATFTFNGSTQTLGPYQTAQGTTVKQLKWPVPSALWGTSKTLVITPTSKQNGTLLSGIMIDNLRTTCN